MRKVTEADFGEDADLLLQVHALNTSPHHYQSPPHKGRAMASPTGGGEQPQSQGALPQVYKTRCPLFSALGWFPWPLPERTLPGPYPTVLSKTCQLKDQLATQEQPSLSLILFFLSPIAFAFALALPPYSEES